MEPSRTSARTTPPIVPRPPKIETPPSTTAVTAVSSKPVPTLAAAVELRSEMTTPARPATAPDMTNSQSLMRLTRTPEKRAASSLAPMAKTLRPKPVACRSTPKAIASAANRTIVLGIAVPPTLPKARSVHEAGKSVTDWSPMTTKARPRKSDSVPIVTASDGRPSRVTSRPLTMPQAAPTAMHSTMISSIGWPAFQSLPITALDSASTDATDRSISAATTTSASGSAMSATSERSSDAVVNESADRKSDDRPLPTIHDTRIRPTISVSQRISRERRVDSAGTAGAPLSQGGIEPQPDPSVEGDRDDQQRADRGLLPERVDLEDDQRRGDRPQQHGSDRRAVDAARAAVDRHAAHDGGGDDGELVAGARGRVDGAEARGEEHAAQAGQRAGHDEGAEHAAPGAHAGQAGGLRAGADRIQLAARAEVAQVLPDEQHHDQRDDRQRRDAEDRAGADVQERVGQRLGVDLAAVGPQERKAAQGIEGAQRDDERRHAAVGDEHAVQRTSRRAEPHPEEEDDGDRQRRMVAQQRPGHEGAQREHRADREVDVARDEHERLTCREDGEDGRVEREVAQRVGVQEARLDDRGDGDEQRQRADDAHLADAEDDVGQPARAGAGLRRDRAPAGRRGRRVDLGAHAAAASTRPVAARMMRSSSASARGISPVIRPSCITRTRSAMPSTSGSSEEIIRTAIPWPARSLSSRWTSLLVPTSMPRVGSSTIRTLGSVDSHLASTTFCWLPPDSVPTLSLREWNLSCSRWAHSSAMIRSALPAMSPMRVSRARLVIVALRLIDRSMTRPCWRRSSGTKATPAAIAAVGLPLGSRRPWTSTWPPSALSTPKIARATSLRPAPTRPASATISPARTSKETSVKTPSRVRRDTDSSGAPIAAAVLGNSASRSRPTMRRTRSSSVRPAVFSSDTMPPSRMTVTVSQIAKTSSRRCEMKRMPAPRSCSVRTTPNRRATSGPLRAAVGSSMISTRASKLRALAISTTCWSAIDRPRTGRSASRRTPRRCRSSAACRCMALRSMRRSAPSGWRPIAMFSATLRSGNS